MLPALSASPRSGVLTGWGNAWLAGLVGLDDVITQVHCALGGEAAPHTLGDEPLVLGLGALRAAGAERLRLVLPVPGDATGLPGPPEVNRDAITAGEAVLVLGPNPPLVLVPGVVVHGPAVEGRLESVHWRVLSAGRIPPPSAGLRAAEHELSDAIRMTTAALLHLDIASARPEVLALLRDRGEEEPGPGLGPGHPPAAHALLARAERLSALLDLAARDDGAAVTASEISRRTAALRSLSAAVRRAYEAAYEAFDPSYAAVRPPR
ncbi:hypothetical protein [Frankia sp. R82]|uniref:hypothetical protein n=1 Tax=Frankia sp. R82 TaxID=2950553 RepID=UPI0020445FFF|nr:hypothetical protein [Frankia sp. R82]MCM3884490.1 hypothetical protein [Frankia sp. R82]